MDNYNNTNNNDNQGYQQNPYQQNPYQQNQQNPYQQNVSPQGTPYLGQNYGGQQAPPPYQGANYGQQPQVYPQGPVVINQLEHKKDNLAVCSLVFGIMGAVFCWLLVIPIVCTIAGLIMGIISLVKTGQHSGVALAGVIVSAISLVLSVIFTLLYILVL
ncbi:DUF4190 domain-containing protein [Eisenbergiella porci]|uniref:DUF4190 domain-containing protein n=1 Tax=Eisenbergiella porci TaxID=2652274 RepID=UPI002A825D58|nr:hypothetical protein [Eisenbergiella porci]